MNSANWQPKQSTAEAKGESVWQSLLNLLGRWMLGGHLLHMYCRSFQDLLIGFWGGPSWLTDLHNRVQFLLRGRSDPFIVKSWFGFSFLVGNMYPCRLVMRPLVCGWLLISSPCWHLVCREGVPVNIYCPVSITVAHIGWTSSIQVAWLVSFVTNIQRRLNTTSGTFHLRCRGWIIANHLVWPVENVCCSFIDTLLSVILLDLSKSNLVKIEAHHRQL